MAGRPRHYDTEVELQIAIDAYFEHIKGLKESSVDDKGNITEKWIRHPEPATITGLALFLDFESRQSVYDYLKDGEFSYALKKARLRVECEYEKNLSGNSPTGSIFALKNLGWIDKNELGFTDTDGKDVAPVQVFQLPDNKRDDIKADA